jgi:hypothetical protein
MKCPECEKLGLKSVVYEGTAFSTCVYSQPYYDENGIYYRPDNNKTTTEYKCSNGHSFKIEHGVKDETHL